MAIKVKREGSFAEKIKFLQASAVEVGIHGGSGEYDGGTTVAQIGAVHEYGNERVPERSFLRSTLNENRKKYIGIIGKIAQQELNSHFQALRQMGKLGTVVQNDIKNKIVAIQEPPNSPTTIAAKKSSNPLIDTGQLLNSIRWKYAKPD